MPAYTERSNATCLDAEECTSPVSCSTLLSGMEPGTIVYGNIIGWKLELDQNRERSAEHGMSQPLKTRGLFPNLALRVLFHHAEGLTLCLSSVSVSAF